MGFGKRNLCAGWLLLGWMLGWSGIAAAQTDSPQTEFKRARNAYAYGNYGDAIRRFRQLLYPFPGRLQSRFLRREAHKYLGISYYYLYLRTREKKFKRQAERELTRFLLRAPEATLDPLLFPPNLIAFFNRIRLKNKRRLEALLRKQQKRRKAVPVQVVPLEVEKNFYYHSPWLAVIPFGVPQFLAGQNVKGGLLAAGEISTLGLNILAYFMIVGMQITNDKFNLGRFKQADVPKVIGWQIVQGASIGIFGALVIYGIIDGWILLRKRRVTVLPRLPRINREELSLPSPPPSPSFSITAQ